jgi:ribulose 1,5-bisphosphate carboxylase large subunit-like protein
MEWYNNYGVKPYKDATLDDDKVLITTVDKPDGGIDSQEVMRIIQEVIIGK